ncbi:hypothetical protein K0A97_03330 [Patescibacteria group bacterium]|nr:hypothetical protein [Patescibacteria group bacterium]
MGNYFETIFSYGDTIFQGMAFATILALGIISVFIFLGIYVYHSITWMNIAKKFKYKNSWLAWIPLGEWAMRLHLGNIHWAWIFLVLVPVVGWIILFIFLTVATWRIFEKRGYFGWLSLFFPAMFVPTIAEVSFVIYLVIIGIISWKKETIINLSPKRSKRVLIRRSKKRIKK